MDKKAIKLKKILESTNDLSELKLFESLMSNRQKVISNKTWTKKYAKDINLLKEKHLNHNQIIVKSKDILDLISKKYKIKFSRTRDSKIKVSYKPNFIITKNSQYKQKHHTKTNYIKFIVLHENKGHSIVNRNKYNKHKTQRENYTLRNFISTFVNFSQNYKKAKHNLKKLKHNKIPQLQREYNRLKNKQVPKSLIKTLKRNLKFYKNLHFIGITPTDTNSFHYNIIFSSNVNHSNNSIPTYICSPKQFQKQTFIIDEAFNHKENYISNERLCHKCLRTLGINYDYNKSQKSGDLIKQKGVDMGQGKRKPLHYDTLSFIYTNGNKIAFANEIDGPQHQILSIFPNDKFLKLNPMQKNNAQKINRYLNAVNFKGNPNTKDGKFVIAQGYWKSKLTKQLINDSLKDEFSIKNNIYLNRTPMIMTKDKTYSKFCEIRNKDILKKMHISGKRNLRRTAVIIESLSRNLAFFCKLNKNNSKLAPSRKKILASNFSSILNPNHKDILKLALKRGTEDNNRFPNTVTQRLYKEEQKPKFRNYYKEFGATDIKSNHMINNYDLTIAKDRLETTLDAEERNDIKVTQFLHEKFTNQKYRKKLLDEKYITKNEINNINIKNNKIKSIGNINKSNEYHPLLFIKNDINLKKRAPYSAIVEMPNEAINQALRYDKTGQFTKIINKSYNRYKKHIKKYYKVNYNNGGKRMVQSLKNSSYQHSKLLEKNLKSNFKKHITRQKNIQNNKRKNNLSPKDYTITCNKLPHLSFQSKHQAEPNYEIIEIEKSLKNNVNNDKSYQLRKKKIMFHHNKIVNIDNKLKAKKNKYTIIKENKKQNYINNLSQVKHYRDDRHL